MPDAHPIFATFFATAAALGERTGYGGRRSEALARATGRLLIVGLGPGHDLEHLPGTVTEVLAVEPEPTMRRYCARRVDRSPVPARLVAAVVEHLPLPDECVDAALVALVLCSVASCAEPAPCTSSNTSMPSRAVDWLVGRTGSIRCGPASPPVVTSPGTQESSSVPPASIPADCVP
jgi:hypothetical protein